jgi:hypothetical protein
LFQKRQTDLVAKILGILWAACQAAGAGAQTGKMCCVHDGKYDSGDFPDHPGGFRRWRNAACFARRIAHGLGGFGQVRAIVLGGRDARTGFALIPREGRKTRCFVNRTEWETNMTLTLTRLIAASLITLPVAAFAADYMAADANQDGMLSLEEVQAILPEVTTDTFMAVDADGDGLINADELAVAQTEGLMPEADS